MKVNEYQLSLAAEKVSALVDPYFSELSDDDQKEQIKQTSRWLFPLLQALPEGANPATLNEHSDFIFACAEDFLLEACREHPGYRMLSEEKIRASLDSAKIQKVALNLYRFAYHALLAFPTSDDLQSLLDNFDHIDMDAELIHLSQDPGDS